MSSVYRSIAAGVVMSLLCCVTACDEDKKPAAPVEKPAATPSATATKEAPRRMPEVSVHPKGVSVGLDELMFSVPSFDSGLARMLKKYPVDKPDQVILNMGRKVKTPMATKIFYALVDAGAKKIEVRTKPRGTFPGKLVITSEKEVASGLPPCTYVGMILESLGATFWKKQGGLAKKYTKGMAGPDLSAMHVVMHKEAQTCNSKVFLFSAEPEVDWGHAFDIATSVKAADPAYESIDQYVLLREDPVPGKPVDVGEE